MKLKVYETKNYFGIQKEDQLRHKIGYINKSGWLNVSEEFKEILSKLDLKWEWIYRSKLTPQKPILK